MEYQVYEDSKKEWRWRLKAANGKTIADSGEGYRNRQDCLDAIKLVKDSRYDTSPGVPVGNAAGTRTLSADLNTASMNFTPVGSDLILSVQRATEIEHLTCVSYCLHERFADCVGCLRTALDFDFIVD